MEIAAAKAGMDPKTAQKYLRVRCLPSEMQQKHMWRTRPDPFAEVWEEIEQWLRVEPGLQAKTLFEHLQQREPGRFGEGQVRTLQRPIKIWRALEGPLPGSVFCTGLLSRRTMPVGFTHCRELAITINRQAFPHLIYHFYSAIRTGRRAQSAIRKVLRVSARVYRTPGGSWAACRRSIA